MTSSAPAPEGRPKHVPALTGDVSTTRHIRHLDGLRATAVLAVLLRHAWGLSGSPYILIAGIDFRPLMVMLSCGVDLFFVLSGFLLAQSFIRKRQQGAPPPSYRGYWTARVLRIGPPYWLILVLVVIFMTPNFIPAERVFSAQGLAIFLAHIPILQTTFISSFGAYAVETPFWTLTIEVLFYASLPVLVKGFYGRRWMVTIPVMGVVGAVWLYLVRNSADSLVQLVNTTLNVFPPFPEEAVRFFLSHQFPAFLLDFALGIAAALVVVSKRRAMKDHVLFQRLTSPRAGLVLFLAGSVTVLASMWVLGTLSIRNGYANPLSYMGSDRASDLIYYYMESMPFAVGFSMLLLGLHIGPAWLHSGFSLRPLAFIGTIGYSVYLIHMPVLQVFNQYPWLAGEFDPSSHFLKLLTAGGVTIIGLSTLFFYTIERPAMNWSRAAGRRASRVAPVAPLTEDSPVVPEVGQLAVRAAP